MKSSICYYFLISLLLNFAAPKPVPFKIGLIMLNITSINDTMFQVFEFFEKAA